MTSHIFRACIREAFKNYWADFFRSGGAKYYRITFINAVMCYLKLSQFLSFPLAYNIIHKKIGVLIYLKIHLSIIRGSNGSAPCTTPQMRHCCLWPQKYSPMTSGWAAIKVRYETSRRRPLHRLGDRNHCHHHDHHWHHHQVRITVIIHENFPALGRP